MSDDAIKREGASGRVENPLSRHAYTKNRIELFRFLHMTEKRKHPKRLKSSSRVACQTEDLLPESLKVAIAWPTATRLVLCFEFH